MQLKSAISTIPGLREVVQMLRIKSGLAQRVLLSSSFLTNESEISSQLTQIERAVDIISSTKHDATLKKIAIKLEQVRDIGGTLKGLKNKQTLNDIELFEIKHFVLLAEEIKQLTKNCYPLNNPLPCLNEAIAVLDPDNERIPTFHIANNFHPQLSTLRKQLKEAELSMEQGDKDATEISESIRLEITQIEDEVRQKLSEQLHEHWKPLHTTLNLIGELDIIFAKAHLAIEEGMVKPMVKQGNTQYTKVFNPPLKHILSSQGKEFQPIDIELQTGTCLVTGANMAGKTVLLKTLALCQALCQFAFFIPAQGATISPVKNILTSFTDTQSELSGLSSYASEMLTVSNMVKEAKRNTPLLILIDELARTTNPTEGRAIVSAVANILNATPTISVITTHYGGLSTQCRKLRVKGFVEQEADVTITVKNIGNYIDYSLLEDDAKDVPHEALKIAKILGIDREIVDKSNELLNK